MKNIFYILACLIGLSNTGQNSKIEFVDADWKTHLTSAKKENKLIFFDAYTTWCGPCKMMDKNVFTRDEVANLFNEEFINAKYDMEKGEGVALKNQYEVNAYPTYLFINGNGEVIHKVVGGMTAEEFMNEAKKALSLENTINGLAKQFEASNHSEASAIAYLKALSKAYEDEKRSEVSKLYFDGLSESDLLNEYYWKQAVKYLNNPSSKAFSYLYSNRQKLKERFNEREVDNYFRLIFSSSVYRIKKSYRNKKGVEEAENNNNVIRKLLREGNDYSKVLLAKLDLIEFASKDQWDKFANKVDTMYADKYFSDKSHVIIEAANEIATANKEEQYESVFKWANYLENNNPTLFTQIQIAELLKRVFTRQGKKEEANEMYKKEQTLRKEATDKRLMQPPMMQN